MSTWSPAFLALLVSACGAAEAREERIAPIMPRAHPGEAPQGCRIEAARAEALTVALEGHEPFTVSVSDGALAFVPGADEPRIGVEAEHPLRFHADARIDDQQLTTLREEGAAAGILHVVAGLSIAGLSPRGAGLAAHVVLGRTPGAPRGIELVVGPIALDCAAIGAPSEPEPERSSSSLERVPGGELHVASRVPLVVRAVGDAHAHLEVRPRDGGGFVPLWVVDRQGEDLRVVIAFSGGARVEGWVAATAIRPPTGAELELVETIVRSRAPSTIRYGSLGLGQSPAVAALEGEIVGDASLRPRSPIFAEHGEGRWATSAPHPLEVRVRWQRGATHARIVELPGVFLTPQRAWVHRADVSLVER